MSVYSQLAETLQYISPDFYKQRFFKKLRGLSADNILDRKIEPELFWLKQILPADAVFIDIGANVGAYLFLLENQLKPENIFAFEPNPNLYKRLRRIFPKTNIFQTALSDENTTAEFKIPRIGGKKINSRGTLKNHTETGETSSEIFKVKVQKLDDFEAIKNLKKIDFIKIDVEGNELKTLRGARETIKKFKPILMVEIEQRHHDFPVWEIISEVASWNFVPHFLSRKTLQPQVLTKEIIETQNTDNVKVYEDYINNIIFIPRR